MDDLLYLLGDVRPWHWWALAAILIAVEIMSPAFYFLWPGIAAALVGVLLLIFPGMSPSAQILVFSVCAVAATVAWKRLAPKAWSPTEPHPTLNRRAAQYEGHKARAAVDFSGGEGAVIVGDTRWSAATEDGSNPVAGEMLVVTGAEGIVLKVRKAEI
ncbi:MAG TPA: NfeD family protein [Alphaproteobacteria bacterium]|nr:NfeD family protein [Alphaproteobacteria bacterium]